jgi:hypothetical protein
LTSLLPEDCRISTLLRRLHHENNLEVFFSVTTLLKEALSAPENSRYIRRALETIMESLLDILQNGPSSDARSEGARCLGVTGFALEGDTKKYENYIYFFSLCKVNFVFLGTLTGLSQPFAEKRGMMLKYC